MKRIEEFRCSSFFTFMTLAMKIRPLTGKFIPLKKKMNNLVKKIECYDPPKNWLRDA